MTDTQASLQRKISSAEDLQSVVRTMKAMAASSISQYEQSVRALDEYYRALELSLSVCLAGENNASSPQLNGPFEPKLHSNAATVALVLGSDQGLVGQFNEAMADFVVAKLAKLPGEKNLWAIGERIRSRLVDVPLQLTQQFTLPNSIAAITKLVSEVLLALEMGYEQGHIRDVYVFYHQPLAKNTYAPRSLRLLPLDAQWRSRFTHINWPGTNVPEVIGNPQQTLLAFVHEYLFVSLFRTCAGSLASENASRLLAMQRAEKNIEELVSDMQRHFHRLRQEGIDEELFDLLAGFEVLRD